MRPILSTGKHNSQHGFTLLELMLVVVVVGLIAGVVTLSLPEQDSRQLLRESERIRYLLRHAQQQAIFRGQDVGISVTAQQISTVIQSEQGWQRLAGNTTIEIPEALKITLDIEGQAVRLLASAEPRAIQPQLLFTSDGQYQSFHFQLSDSQHHIAINHLYEVE